jgi:hypothetical protein
LQGLVVDSTASFWQKRDTRGDTGRGILICYYIRGRKEESAVNIMKKFAEAHDAIWDEAAMLTRDTMQHAAGWIDDQFGKGYAKRHPEFLASFLAAAMNAYSGSVIAAAIQDSNSRS